MRDRRRRRAHYKQQLFLVGRFKRRICGECRIVVYKFTVVVVLFIDGFFVAIEFIVEIFVIGQLIIFYTKKSKLFDYF
jgi:hypothetical protein